MDVKLPKLGEGSESGTVVSLFVKVGDQVTEGQILLELENEKAVAPIPAPVAGTIQNIRVKEGDKLSVGQVILSIAEGETSAAKPAPPAEVKAVDPAPAPAVTGEPVAAPAPVAAPPATSEPLPTDGKPGVVPAAAPSVRKTARELGIDLARVRGSEPGGRIVMADLRAHIQRREKLAAAPQAASKTAAKPAAEPVDFARWGAISRKPMSSLRKVISQRMTENWTTIPHVTQFDEADITDLLALRKKFAGAYEANGAHLTLTVIVLKVLAAALKRQPIFNASLDETTNEIVFKEYYHLGIAVDTDAGLLVPVIRDVDKKSLLQLSKELSDLAAKARARKVSLEELKGGSFTISNQGGIGGGHFTPIINKPESAILGLGKGAWKAMVKDKKIEPRMMLPLALSYDHRLIDGGAAARFIVELVQALEQFPEADVQL